jgi:hypothetical protein
MLATWTGYDYGVIWLMVLLALLVVGFIVLAIMEHKGW